MLLFAITDENDFSDEESEESQLERLPTQHMELRQIAEQNTKKMRKEIRDRLLKNKTIDRNFEVGSIVVLSIPRIDRHIVDRPILPCKIVEKTEGKYRLGCASGILDITYGANELNPVEADYPELDNIPIQRLSLREAARTQSVVDVVAGRQTKCMCQSACLSSRCRCRKAQQKCNIYCHKTSSNCQNS
jgi:hypothetical protein